MLGKGENKYYKSILRPTGRRELAERGKVKISIIQVPCACALGIAVEED